MVHGKGGWIFDKSDFNGNVYTQHSDVELGCGGVDSSSLKELSSVIFLPAS